MTTKKSKLNPKNFPNKKTITHKSNPPNSLENNTPHKLPYKLPRTRLVIEVVCPICEKNKQKQKEYNEKYQQQKKIQEAVEYFTSQSNTPVHNFPILATYPLPNTYQEDELWLFYQVFAEINTQSRPIYIDTFNKLYIKPNYSHIPLPTIHNNNTNMHPNTHTTPYFTPTYINNLLSSRKIYLKALTQYKKCTQCNQIKRTYDIPTEFHKELIEFFIKEKHINHIISSQNYLDHFLNNPWTKHQPVPKNFDRSKYSLDGWKSNCRECNATN